jgi:hypothetical protein
LNQNIKIPASRAIYFQQNITQVKAWPAAMKMAGVAGLEPVTSAVTGQRSNQLSYTPAMGNVTLKKKKGSVKFWLGFGSVI